MSTRRIASMLVSLIMIFTLVACSAPAAQEAAPSAEGGTSAEEAVANGETEKKTIGIAVPVLTNPYWRTYTDYCIAACEQLGCEYIICDANESDSDQLDQIMGLISSEVDGILLVANSAAVTESLLDQASDANIPVVLSARYPGYSPSEYSGTSYCGYIGCDNKISGYSVAQALYDEGCRKFVAIGGMPGASVADDRSTGLANFLADHPDVELLQEMRNGELREDGMTDTENFLSAFPGPSFDGIWTYNDDTALGAVEALTAAGCNGQVKVGGIDILPEAREAIHNGDMCFTTSASAFTLPYASIVMLFDAVNGYIPEGDTGVLQAEYIKVDASTIGEYEEHYINNVPVFDLTEYSRTFHPELTTADLLNIK